MAVQSKSFCRISANDEVVLQVFMEYEDTDFRVTNDDGDPDDFRVIRWYGTNGAYERTVTLYRANGNVWRAQTFAPLEVFSVNAGGQVRYEFDVPKWSYS
jgi:hypothetical protein